MANKLFRKVVLFCTAIALGSSYWVSQMSLVTLGASGEGHTTWYHAVDAGEIRYGGTTKYTTSRAHGIAAWNAMGKVYFGADTASTIQDLTFSDVYTAADWNGYYMSYPGADTIRFNDRTMQNRTSSQNKKTATHEMGHALGLADHEDSYYSNIIMYGKGSSVIYLQSHDKADYNDKW